MSEQNQFDWVDFYKELSSTLLQYKNKRLECVFKSINRSERRSNMQLGK